MDRSNTGFPSLKVLLLAGFVIYCAYQTYIAGDTRNWKEMTAKVTGSDVEEGYREKRSNFDYASRRVSFPVVTYAYVVNHVSYEGRARLKSCSDYFEAGEYAQNMYPKGTRLQIRYNPTNPSVSTLTRPAI